MDYGKILSRAWQIIWKYKILWLFGILSGCGNNGNLGSGGVNRSGVNYRFDAYDPPENLPPQMYHFFRNLVDFFERSSDMLGFYLVLLILLVFLLSLIAFFIRVYGQAGLIRGVGSLEQDQPDKLSFAQVHETVKPFYWRLFGFQLIIFFASLIVVGLIVLIMIAGTALTFGIALLCFVPLIFVLVLLGWAVSVIIKQAVVAMLVDDLAIGDALSRGWDVVRGHAVDYLVMGLILLIGGGVVGFIFTLPQLIALAPLASAIFQSAFSEDWQNILNGLWISLACLIAYWPVFLVLRGILRSYIESAWVLTYFQATGKGDLPDEPELLEPEVEPA